MTDSELLNSCNGCKERFSGCHDTCEIWAEREKVAEKIRKNKAKYKNEEYNTYTQEKIKKMNRGRRSNKNIPC